MNFANLFAGIVFGAIGFVLFIRGKKQALAKPMIIGIALMVYSYFITNTIWLWVIGISLTVVAIIFPD